MNLGQRPHGFKARIDISVSMTMYVNIYIYVYELIEKNVAISAGVHIH